MDIRARRARLYLHKVDAEVIRHSVDTAWLGIRLGDLRRQFDETVVMRDPVTGLECRASLAPWRDAGDDTIITWGFQYLPWWLRPFNRWLTR